MENSNTYVKDEPINLAKFAGKIETRQLPFYSFMKIVITISILSAIVMIALR